MTRRNATLKWTLAAVFGLAASLAGFAPARAALVADYELEGNLNSGVGAANPLTITGSPGTPSYGTVPATTDGTLAFSAGQGVQYNSAALPSNSIYSMAMLFELSSVAPQYVEVVSFTNTSSDKYLYIYNNAGNHIPYFYPYSSNFGTTVIADSTYYTLVMTRDASNIIKGYVDGVLQFSINDAANSYGVMTSNQITFFAGIPGGSQMAGNLARMQVYDTALSGAEASSLVLAPEPASAALLAAGGLLMLRRRRVA